MYVVFIQLSLPVMRMRGVGQTADMGRVGRQVITQYLYNNV
jgi:hypothetical protein